MAPQRDADSRAGYLSERTGFLSEQSRQALVEAEAERIRRAREEAQAEGRELLTPLAARTLFSKSGEAIRKAVRLGHVAAPFTLRANERDVALIDLGSAVDYWGQPDANLLIQMRANAHNLGIGYLVYSVLHPTPLVTVTLRDSAAME